MPRARHCGVSAMLALCLGDFYSPPSPLVVPVRCRATNRGVPSHHELATCSYGPHLTSPLPPVLAADLQTNHVLQICTPSYRQTHHQARERPLVTTVVGVQRGTARALVQRQLFSIAFRGVRVQNEISVSQVGAHAFPGSEKSPRGVSAVCWTTSGKDYPGTWLQISCTVVHHELFSWCRHAP